MPDQGSFNFNPTSGNSGREERPITRSAERFVHIEDSRREVEGALTAAEGLGVNDPAAVPAFAYVETLAVKCADMELQMRTFEKIGGFHERRGDFATALKKYRVSLQSAKCLSVVSEPDVEDGARLRFKCLKIEKLGDPAFENLKKAMRELTEACSYWVRH